MQLLLHTRRLGACYLEVLFQLGQLFSKDFLWQSKERLSWNVFPETSEPQNKRIKLIVKIPL